MLAVLASSMLVVPPCRGAVGRAGIEVDDVTLLLALGPANETEPSRELASLNANGDEIVDFAGEVGLAVGYACGSSAVRR
jgi:hypothetical protein